MIDFAEAHKLLSTYAEEMTKDDFPTSCVTSSVSKGETITVKAKRSRHAVEPVKRGASGLHTFSCLINFKGVATCSWTIKEVDPTSGEITTHENETVTTDDLDEVTKMVDDWRARLEPIETRSRQSLAEATAPEKTVRKTPARKSTPKVETPPTTLNGLPYPRPSGAVLIKDAEYFGIDIRHYTKVGQWYSPKVKGEYTHEELVEFWPDKYTMEQFEFRKN